MRTRNYVMQLVVVCVMTLSGAIATCQPNESTLPQVQQWDGEEWVDVAGNADHWVQAGAVELLGGINAWAWHCDGGIFKVDRAGLDPGFDTDFGLAAQPGHPKNLYVGIRGGLVQHTWANHPLFDQSGWASPAGLTSVMAAAHSLAFRRVLAGVCVSA